MGSKKTIIHEGTVTVKEILNKLGYKGTCVKFGPHNHQGKNLPKGERLYIIQTREEVA